MMKTEILIPRIKNKTVMPILTASLQICTGNSSQVNQARKKQAPTMERRSKIMPPHRLHSLIETLKESTKKAMRANK